MRIQNCVLAVALALPSFVFAASPSQALQVHVPFSFIVGDKQFAAGDYRVVQTDTGVIYVQGEGKAVATLTVPSEMKVGAPSSLRFTSTDQHYLTSVQVEGAPSRSLIVAEERKLTLNSSR